MIKNNSGTIVCYLHMLDAEDSENVRYKLIFSAESEVR